MNPHPLDYASPSNVRLPHSELASLSLSFTAFWVSCIVMTCLSALVEQWAAMDTLATFAFAGLTMMAMFIFIPIGFIASLLAITEQQCRRRCAYVCAAINGGALLIAVLAGIYF